MKSDMEKWEQKPEMLKKVEFVSDEIAFANMVFPVPKNNDFS